LLHAFDQILFAVKAKQVIAQMITERAALVVGLAEQLGGGETLARDEIERAPNVARAG
jgi:hypothetical protein